MLFIVTEAYQLHVLLSLANLNIQNSLKHLNARHKKTLTESMQNPELSSHSFPLGGQNRSKT